MKICNMNIFRFTIHVVYQTYCFFGWKYSKYALVIVILKFAIANIKSQGNNVLIDVVTPYLQIEKKKINCNPTSSGKNGK